MNIRYVLNFPFPPNFKFYGGVDPSPVLLSDNTWLLAATGSISGDKTTFGSYLFHWDGKNTAIMLGKVSNARSLFTADNNSDILNWAVNGNDGNDVLRISWIEGAQVKQDHTLETVPLPAARWIGDPSIPYELTDDLLRTKLRLTDTLLNAVREALIKNKLGT